MTIAAPPSWLPPMAKVNPWHERTYDELYAVFRRDLLNAKLTYLGCNVWFYPDTEEEGKETIFWHLTSRDDRTQHPPVRLPDLRRSERLPWIKALITHCPDKCGDILDWDHEEGDGSIKTYIWLHRLDFVIILKRLPDGRRRLITSYHLDGDHQRNKIRKKYDRRLPRKQKAPASGGPTPSTMGG
jgi:hypothetical protein